MNTDANQIAARFENESERARQIVSERGKFWACRLAIELLHSHFDPITKSFGELKAGQSYKRTSRVAKKEAIGWLICKLEDLRNLITHLQGPVCNDFIASLNHASKEGSGSPIAILEAVKKISTTGRELILWEEEIRFTILPEKLRSVQENLRSATTQLLEELNSLAAKIEAPLKKTEPSGIHKLQVFFKEPRQIAKLNKQLSALVADVQKNPQDWIGWA